jgi:hypothetical protein
VVRNGSKRIGEHVLEIYLRLNRPRKRDHERLGAEFLSNGRKMKNLDGPLTQEVKGTTSKEDFEQKYKMTHYSLLCYGDRQLEE